MFNDWGVGVVANVSNVVTNETIHGAIVNATNQTAVATNDVVSVINIDWILYLFFGMMLYNLFKRPVKRALRGW